MKLKTLFLISLVAIACLSLATFVQAPRPFRGFSMSIQPDLIEAMPGDSVTVNGSIFNFGMYWISDLNLTAKGLPDDFNVEIVPQHFDQLKIIREWNPIQGLYRVPETFLIKIQVPANAAGVFAVNVIGQEYQSWKKLSNSTSFVLRITSTPKISISDIQVPEKVVEFQSFNISFTVNNEGVTDQSVTLTIDAPEDWNVSPDVLTSTVKTNSSEKFQFGITPTNTSGEISAVLEYPFKQTIMNMTKRGPYLIPTTPEIPTIEVPTGLSTWASSTVAFAQENPIVVIVSIVVIAIIVWYFASTYRFYLRRKKPEEVKKETKKQIELPATEVTSTLQ